MKKTLFLLSIISLYSGLAAEEIHDFEYGMDSIENESKKQPVIIRKLIIEDFFYKHIVPAFEAYQNGQLTEESFRNALKTAVANLEDTNQQKNLMYYLENYGPRFFIFIAGMIAGRLVL